jgi:glutamate 5-kinase
MRYKRIVVKLGTNLLTGGTDALNEELMAGLVKQVASLHKEGFEILLVSSGAVAAGRKKLNIQKDRKDIPFKQILSSVGQSQLMKTYEQLFNKHDIVVAQALLTKSNLTNRYGYINARNTLLGLTELGVICIINENDVVATDELDGAQFGDNDNLSAIVANLIDADLLVILTDINGLYTDNPQKNSKAKLIKKVDKIDSKIQRLASGTIHKAGTGGMITKIQAAKLATSSGITVFIANGAIPDVLTNICHGKNMGTEFSITTSKMESKKRWLVCGFSSKGRITIDNGAVKALLEHNKSLLPAGVVGMQGKFQRGDVIDIYDERGDCIGRGISNYGYKDVVAIMGAQSNDISKILGHEFGDDIIHRNNMALV